MGQQKDEGSMKGLLVVIVFSIVVLGSAYAFAAAFALTGVENIAFQSETVDTGGFPDTCIISGGITCNVT